MASAIDWMVRLRSGSASADELQRFEAWRAADPGHARAWQRIEERLAQPLQAMSRIERHLPGQQVQIRSLLARPATPSRRALLRALALLAPGMGALALAVDRATPVAQLMADLRTATGERRRYTLPDGSLLMLNARSAADLDFAAYERQVHLLRGDAIVHRVRTQGRPTELCLRTPHARLYPDSRAFVGLAAEGTRVFALQGPVRVVMASGSTHWLGAGQGAAFDGQGLLRGVRVDAGLADWQDGYLSAAPLPLGEVVAALQRYTPRLLQVSERAAGLAVHASLPLDDVDRSLRALAESLPLQVRHMGPWVRMDLADSA